MQLEVGQILEGKITGVLKFGAFVDLGEGKSGMVHISEVARVYVNDIHEHCKEGETVKVKVISIADDGKISLSMKRVEDKPRPERQKNQGQRQEMMLKDKDEPPRPVHHSPKKQVKKETFSAEDLANAEYAYEPKSSVTDAGFEDMLSKFKMSSEDRMSGLKTMDVKKGRRRK